MGLDEVFGAAERSYFKGLKTEHRDDWIACVAVCNAYLEAGGTKNVHPFLNFALNRLGRIREALESCSAGLAIEPENVHLDYNRRLYEAHLGVARDQPVLH
jgi:hypothetical protein